MNKSLTIPWHTQGVKVSTDNKSLKLWINNLNMLKALDTIGKCQRLVFSFGVSQHMHKITNRWKFELNCSSKLQDNNGRETTLVTQSCVLSVSWFRGIKILFWGLKIKFICFMWKLLLYRKLCYFRGSRFLQCLYYKELSIAACNKIMHTGVSCN